MSRDKYYDNTRISSGRRCLRRFLFRHVLDLESTVFADALAFGAAWHSAMDVIWQHMSQREVQNLNVQEIADEAYQAFILKWMAEGGPDPAEIGEEELKELSPRTPYIALEMIYEYIEQRKPFFADPTFELLHVERPFAVPLNPDDPSLFYVGRIDKIFKKQGLIYGADHKTTTLYSKYSGFRPMFLDSFSPNSQVDGYLHALHMIYGDKATSMWIDAALVHPTVHDVFKFIPVDRQEAQLDSWLFDTQYWIKQIESNWDRLNRLKESGSDEPFLAAFPKNTDACLDFGRKCPFMNVCKMVPNPMTMTQIPADLTKSVWSPFERLELQKIGMEEDT